MPIAISNDWCNLVLAFKWSILCLKRYSIHSSLCCFPLSMSVLWWLVDSWATGNSMVPLDRFLPLCLQLRPSVVYHSNSHKLSPNSAWKLNTSLDSFPPLCLQLRTSVVHHSNSHKLLSNVDFAMFIAHPLSFVSWWHENCKCQASQCLSHCPFLEAMQKLNLGL